MIDNKLLLDCRKELDDIIETQSRLIFAKNNYDEDEATQYGIQLLDFMRKRAMDLREVVNTALAEQCTAADEVASNSIPVERMTITRAEYLDAQWEAVALRQCLNEFLTLKNWLAGDDFDAPEPQIRERLDHAAATARLLLEGHPPHPQVNETPASLTSERGKGRIELAQAEVDRLKEVLHDEIAANLAIRSKGGAHDDEDMPTFLERLIAERDEFRARAQTPVTKYVVTDEMVRRFLSWPLPMDFCPNAGISFDRSLSDKYPHCWPIGTNLLNDPQARAMLEHVLESTEPASVSGEKGKGRVTEELVEIGAEAIYRAQRDPNRGEEFADFKRYYPDVMFEYRKESRAVLEAVADQLWGGK